MLLLKLSQNLFSCFSYVERIALLKESQSRGQYKKTNSILNPVRQQEDPKKEKDDYGDQSEFCKFIA